MHDPGAKPPNPIARDCLFSEGRLIKKTDGRWYHHLALFACWKRRNVRTLYGCVHSLCVAPFLPYVLVETNLAGLCLLLLISMSSFSQSSVCTCRRWVVEAQAWETCAGCALNSNNYLCAIPTHSCPHTRSKQRAERLS